MNYELPFNAWIGYNLFVIHIAVLLILHSFEFKNVKKKKSDRYVNWGIKNSFK